MGVMSAFNERMRSLSNFLHSDELKESGRSKSTDFTRKSPLNFVNLMLILLNKQGLTNTMELMEFFEKIGENEVTKEALSQARMKITAWAFKKIKLHHLKMFYEGDKAKRFKNYLLFACDGSKVELPHHKLLIRVFGGIKNKFKEITSCRANSSIVYDVLNKFIIDFEIDTYKTSEIVLAYLNLANLFKERFLTNMKKVFIFDRSYRSLELFHYLIKNEEKFIFRLRTKDYKKERLKIRNNDQSIDIFITKTRTNHIKDKKLKNELLELGKLNLRIIQVKLVTGEIEYLITNLNKKEFKYEDIVEIYRLRWEIEGSFKVLKSLLKIENISGYSKLAVHQDFSSQIVIYNFMNDMRRTSQIIKDKNNQDSPFKKKKEGKINTNIAIGIFKSKMVNIFLEDDEIKQIELLNQITLKITRYYTNPSTKNYERPINTPPRKNPTNCRRSF